MVTIVGHGIWFCLLFFGREPHKARSTVTIFVLHDDLLQRCNFTTLGFGDVKPQTEVAAIIVMAEVITRYIMLGGLISILANKLARRS